MANHDSKKYFVKDEALHGIDNDQFHYTDISKVLSEIIDTNTPPFNVAVIGKWGLGKSSLVNLVMDQCKKDTKKYCIQEINAWKYEKESLRRVFLKQLWQGLNDKKIHSFEIIRREILDIVKGEIQKDFSNTKKINWNFIKVPVLIAVISFFIFTIYECVLFYNLDLPLFTSFFWSLTFLGYCDNVGTLLFIPVIVTILTKIMEEYRQKNTQKFELNFPIESTDDYEIFLETKIKEYLDKQRDLKIITIIDDLDRLSINKIVEALDALKAFVGFSRCIFVVPFDDEIIKQALDKRRVKEFNDHDDVVESELILDKLFQFKLYLPPLLDFDIQDYALSLAKQEIPDFLNEYCNEDLMKKVIQRVLIHPSVSTPRQVKKLLNSFVNNYMVAFAREQSGKIQPGLLTSENGTMQIAKMSVLQSDFNNFYDLLFKDMSCLKKILAFHRGEGEGEIPQYLQSYFTKKAEEVESGQFSFELKSEYEPLANFLTKTEKYQVPSIAPYLYLAQDEISIKTGDELQRRVTQALVSGNVQTAKKLLVENSDVAEVILRNVRTETENIANTVSVAISIFDAVNNKYKFKLAQVIIDRTLELINSELYILYTVPPTNIFEIAKIGENQDFNHRFIKIYLSVFLTYEGLQKKQFILALKTILYHYPDFTMNLRSHIREITNFSMSSSQITAFDLLECVNPKDKEQFIYLWGMTWYKKLCEYIDAESDFNDEVITCLNDTFVTLIGIESADELALPLISLSKYTGFLSTLANLLNVKQGDKYFKAILSADKATQIAENVIALDFSQNDSTICKVLTDLPFQITEDNCASFDNFLPYFQNTNELDEVIIYCGKQNYFKILSKTIEVFVSIVFKKEEYDSLLSRTIDYFTDPMIINMFNNLKQRCLYKTNYDYYRELAIVKTIKYSKNCTDKLEQLMNETLRPQLASYHNQSNYLEFVSSFYEIMKLDVSQKSIINYVNVLLNNVFPNNQRGALIAINKISGAIPSDTFQIIYNKIMENCSASAFDDALDVIIDNDDICPREQKDLIAYLAFLKKNLPTTINPNRVLKVLIMSFSTIPNLEEVVIAALRNNAVSMNELSYMVAHFLETMVETDDISATILALCKIKNGDTVILQALSKLEDVSRILAALSPAPNKDELAFLSNLARIYLSIPEGKLLLLKCLSVSALEINLIESTCDILQIVIEQKKQLMDDSKFKSDIVKIIKETFIKTDSNVLREKILLVINALRVKTIFKKGLEGESLEFYKKYTM